MGLSAVFAGGDTEAVFVLKPDAIDMDKQRPSSMSIAVNDVPHTVTLRSVLSEQV
jgi:hypothetical protein